MYKQVLIELKERYISKYLWKKVILNRFLHYFVYVYTQIILEYS